MSNGINVRLSERDNTGRAEGGTACRLPFVLSGDERLRAHEAIREATCCNPGEDVSVERDLRLLEWVRRDPSLFIELIPRKNPNSTSAGAWGANRSWWGTWAYRAAVIGAEQSVMALIGAGVHPDDGEVFLVRPTWLWWRQPERLRTLLAAGANPDSAQQLERAGGFRGEPSSTLLRTCLQQMVLEAPMGLATGASPDISPM